MISAKSLFDRYYQKTSKKLGQNFLFDEKINRKIISAAGDLAEKLVLEIGPGPGGLTLEILKNDIAKLCVVEMDSHWAGMWKELSDQFDGKLQVEQADALNFDLRTVAPQIIISNLPYNISTQLLYRWLFNFNLCEKYVLMFQKEVAERIYAFHGTKSYGRLSVLCQIRAAITKCFDLEPGSFTPPPKIKSTVVKFIPFSNERTLDDQKFKKLDQFLSKVFSCRRKTIIKSMKEFFNDPIMVLEDLGYNEKVRAEEISVQDYKKLCEKYF